MLTFLNRRSLRKRSTRCTTPRNITLCFSRRVANRRNCFALRIAAPPCSAPDSLPDRRAPVRRGCPARDVRKHDSLHAPLALAVTIEPFLTQEFVEARHPVDRGVEQRLHPRRVVGLARQHLDGDHRVLVGGRHRDFGGQAAPAAAISLGANASPCPYRISAPRPPPRAGWG